MRSGALDAIGGPAARAAIAAAPDGHLPAVRLQAVRSVGIRGDQAVARRRAPAAERPRSGREARGRHRRGQTGLRRRGPRRDAALGDGDTFAAWSIRHAIRRRQIWDKAMLVEALSDERRLESALRLTDEAWSIPVVQVLVEVDESRSPRRRSASASSPRWPVFIKPIPTGRATGSGPIRSPVLFQSRPRTGTRPA